MKRIGILILLLVLGASRRAHAQNYALSFDPVNCQNVQIPHQASLNAFPLTVMAWFMVPTNSNGGAIINKYVSSSYNGFQIQLTANLRAWYLRDAANNVFNNGVMDAGPVNDGLWHHVALAVDNTSGRLYLDGVLKSTVAWSGTPGAVTTTQPLSLGVYPGDSCFKGQIDEPSVWNTALTASQIQAYMNQPPVGSESGLVAYYHFNEGSGTNVADATGHGHNGFTFNNPTWVTSGAGTTGKLAMNTLTTGPSAGSGSVILAVNPGQSWTAATNVSWLHLSPANQSGTNSATVIFTLDANTNATRTGTLTIAGQTFTVTQAGASYVPASALTTLVSSGLNSPMSVAVDLSGNVFIADAHNNAIKKWTVTNNTVSTVLSSGLFNPSSVALDKAGNIYISDEGNNAVKKWAASNGAVTTLYSSSDGSFSPMNVAVDPSGNVFVTDIVFEALDQWSVTNGSFAMVTRQGGMIGVAADAAGNAYYENPGNYVHKWTASNNVVTTLKGVIISQGNGLAVDGAGDVYVTDLGNGSANSSSVYKLSASQGYSTTIPVTGLYKSYGVAVDAAQNIYVADTDNTIKELPHAFVDATPWLTSAFGGNFSLPPVLPTNLNLRAQFTPTSDQSWLTLKGITNGVLSFATTTNTGVTRTAHISLLGQSIAFTQTPPGPFTFTQPATNVAGISATFNALVNPEGAATTVYFVYGTNTSYGNTNVAGDIGNGMNTLAVSNLATGLLPRTLYHFQVVASNSAGVVSGGDFTFTTDVALYELGLSNRWEGPQAGADSVVLSVKPQTNTWTATPNVSWLHVTNASGTGSTNLIYNFDANPGPTRTGVITIADKTLTIIQAGSTYLAAGTMTQVASGMATPRGLAADSAGNIYIADYNAAAIRRWSPADNSLTTAVSGLDGPQGVAVDSAGNIFITDFSSLGCSLKKRFASDGHMGTLIPAGGNFFSYNVAVDTLGNAYVAENNNRVIRRWNAADNTVTNLSAGVHPYYGVSVDAAFNVYSTYSPSGVAQWTPALNSESGLPGVGEATAVSVDGAGNLYVTSTFVPSSSLYVLSAVNGYTPVQLALSTTLYDDEGVVVDGTGNVYVSSTHNGTLLELPRAFVDTTPQLQSANAGTASLPPVLPPSQNLRAPFAPSSTQPWLTIAGVTNGVVSYSFSANPSATSRSANINVLNKTILVTQSGILGTSALLQNVQKLGDGSLQFSFTNTPGASFTVLCSSDLTLPLSAWTVIGSPTNLGGTQYQFTAPPATNDLPMFYSVRSP